MDATLAPTDRRLDRFERGLRARMRKLCPKGSMVVVGVSGGPDSTALLVALAAVARSLELSLVAAHLDHGLRGEEARKDRDFVLETATGLGVRFEEAKAPPLDAKGRGLEAAAREVRYEFLLETAERMQGDRPVFVAVAHTASDQAETVLLRILRGASLRGLAAMPESRRLARGARVRLVRPLLAISRDEVEAYLDRKGIEARHDAMNDDARFARVRVRKEILPRAIDLVNPAAESALARIAETARRASRALERDARRLLAKARREDDRFDRKLLAKASDAVLETAVARLLRRSSPEKLSRKHVRAVSALIRSARGSVALPGEQRAWIEDGSLVTGHWTLGTGHWPQRPVPSDKCPVPSEEPAPLRVPGSATFMTHRIEARVVSRGSLPKKMPRETDPLRARLDFARVTGPLAVRGRRASDRFVPLGSSGATTLKRFFIDRKIPRELRVGIPIVTLDDLPIWVVGERIDDRFKVTATTKEVLELRASRISPGDQQ